MFIECTNATSSTSIRLGRADNASSDERNRADPARRTARDNHRVDFWRREGA
jgi:hypothetical protein